MLGKRSCPWLRKLQCIVKDIFGSVTNVPITKDVINAVRMAYFEYTLYLDEERCANADKLQKTVEADKVVEEKSRLRKTKESILELRRADEKAERNKNVS